MRLLYIVCLILSCVGSNVDYFRQQDVRHDSGATTGVVMFTTSLICKLQTHVFTHNKNHCVLFHTHKHKLTHTHTHIHAHKHTNTHTHTLTHTYIHTHTVTYMKQQQSLLHRVFNTLLRTFYNHRHEACQDFVFLPGVYYNIMREILRSTIGNLVTII